MIVTWKRAAAIGVALCILGRAGAWSNDRSVVGRGGTVVPMKGEHKSVRMVRETVDIDVYSKFYDVSVRFWFRNDGPATRVKMGFPETGSGDIQSRAYRTKPAYMFFRSMVDGRPVKVTRVMGDLDNEEQHYTAHWVKDVDFGAGQARVIDVRYRTPLSGIADNCGGDVNSGLRGSLVLYNFTGDNWKGRVDESRLTMRVHNPGYKLSQIKPSPRGLTRKGNVYTWRKTNWQANEALFFIFCELPTGFLCPKSDWLDLTDKDLQGHSARDLSLMRNEIYARWGRPFKDAQLRRYFEAKPWYKPDARYSDDRLSETERKNAQFIQHYQERHHLNW